MGHTWLGKFLVMSLSWAPGRKNTPVCGLGLTGISGLPFLSKGSCQLLLPFFPPQLKRLWYSWHMPLGRWWKFTFTRVVWCSSRRVELLACFFCLQHGFRDSSLHALLFVGRGEEEMRSIVRFNQPLTEHVYICVYLYISNVCVHKIIVPLPFVDIIAFHHFNTTTVVFTYVRVLLGLFFSLSDVSVNLVSCMSVSLVHLSTPTHHSLSFIKIYYKNPYH